MKPSKNTSTRANSPSRFSPEIFRIYKNLERAMGIEPTSEAWEASILPLYDARSAPYANKPMRLLQEFFNHKFMLECRVTLVGQALLPVLRDATPGAATLVSNTSAPARLGR